MGRTVRLPFCPAAADVVAPEGWHVSRIVDSYEQLPTGQRYDSKTVEIDGDVPVLDQSQEGVLGHHSGDPGVFASLDAPVVTFANHTCAMRVLTTPFSVIQNVFPLIGRPGICDTRFLYYATKGRQSTEEYKGHHPAWRNSYFAYPDLEMQRRIVEILQPFDDLIENNWRRIKVLEEMTRAIYREWFVKFRYPGHEDVPLVDSALGPIPEGWEARRVRDIAEVVRGRSYRSAELVDDGGLPFVNLKCMARGGGFRRNGLKRYIGPYKEEQVVRAGDLVLAVTDLTQGREILARATLVPRLTEGRGIISLDVAKVVPVDDAERLWIFAALGWSDAPDRLKEYANGSTVLHLSPKHVENTEILWAPEPARKRFISTIAPMIDEIEELSEYSGSLARIRNQLLPKLVTGQIDVSTLDLDALVTEKAA